MREGARSQGGGAAAARRTSLPTASGSAGGAPGTEGAGGVDRAAEATAFRAACQGAVRGVDKAVGDLETYLGALGRAAVLVEKQVEPEDARGDKVEALRQASQRLCADRETLVAAREEARAEAGAYRVPASPAEFHGYRDSLPGRVAARAAGPAARAAQAPEMQRFEREVWNVRHEGEPMPGEEEEDVYVAGAVGLKNQKCPVSMQSVLGLEDPVAAACGHIYDRQSVVAYLGSVGAGRGQAKCALAGCRGVVKLANLRSCAEDVARERKRLQREQMRAGAQGGPAQASDVMEL